MTIEELQIVIKANIDDALKGIRIVKEEVKSAIEQSVAPMQKLSTQSKQVATNSAAAMQSAGNSMRNFKAATESATAQQQVLLNKINDLRATIQLAAQDPNLFKPSEVLEMRAEVEKLEKQYNRLGTTGRKANNDIAKSVKNGVSSLRRFGLALFSIRGIYSAISRIVSEYKQTDDNLRAGMELTVNAMGQLLAPAIRVVSNVLQYLIIGFATLIKMFTDFDALSKVTTKSLNKTATATKKLNKELTAMDEVTNLSGEQSGAGGLDLSADLNALAEFNEKIAKVQELFDKWNIQKFVDKLIELGDWVVKNKDWLIILGTTLFSVFGAAKISILVGNIAKLLGTVGVAGAAGKGLAGLMGVMKFLSTIGIISIGVSLLYKGLTGRSLIDDLKEINAAVQANGGWLKGVRDWWNRIKTSIDNVKKALRSGWTNPFGKGGSFSLNLGSLIGGIGGSRFATGGVVNQPTFGLMGEYGNARSNPEIIAPQSIMRDTMIDAFRTVAPQMQQGGESSGQPIFEVNGRELARITYRDYQNEGQTSNKQAIVRRVG